MNNLDFKVSLNRRRFQPVISLLSFLAVIFNMTVLIISVNIVLNIYVTEGSQWTKDIIISRLQASGDIFFEEKSEFIINMIILFAVIALIFITVLAIITNRIRLGDLAEEVRINRFLGYRNRQNLIIILKEMLFDYIISIPFVIALFIPVWNHITTNSPLKYIFKYTDAEKNVKISTIVISYLIALLFVLLQSFLWNIMYKKHKK